MELLNILVCVSAMLISSTTVSSSRLRARRGFCSLRGLDIANGDYSIRAGNSVVQYTCNAGFTLYGSDKMVCFGATWSTDPPTCISNTCSDIQATNALRIEREFNGAVLKFSCDVLHRLVGSDKIICDGTSWSAPTPMCEDWDPPTACDFEAGVCDWKQHDKDEQDWILHTGSTRTTRTGPSFDHTFGPDGEGHYIYFETSGPNRPGHKAILESPLYPAQYSSRCFNFWYHILGEKDIGELEVYIIPDGNNGMDGLSASFIANESMGEDWLEETLQLTRQLLPFQIWFVATRATSYRSDFAIDDIRLSECQTTSTEAATTVSTAVSTTARTTTAPTTKITTSKTNTTVPPTTTTIPTTTSTTPRPPTTTTTRATVAPVWTGRTRPSSLTTEKSPETTFAPGNKTAIKRTTTPPPVKTKLSAESGASSITLYIVVVVGVIVAVCAVVLGVLAYRRLSSRRRSEVSLSSSNPLYNELENQEAIVKFSSENPYEN